MIVKFLSIYFKYHSIFTPFCCKSLDIDKILFCYTLKKRHHIGIAFQSNG